MKITPEITDLVTYQKQKYRVSYYKKKVYDEERLPEDDDVIGQIIYELIKEERKDRKSKNLPHTRRFRYMCCLADEATHVSLYGLLPCVAPISEIIYEGPIAWTPELIEQTKKEAVSEFRLSNYPPSDWQWE